MNANLTAKMQTVNWKAVSQKGKKFTKSTPARSLKQVNTYIQTKYPTVILWKGEGYFFICSNDEEMALKIASLYQPNIFCNNIADQSLEQWLADVKYLLNDSRNK